MRALALAATLLIFALPAWAQDITGLARVIDGDTIDVAGERIRLHGIDTPESRQTCGLDGRDVRCGKAATAALRRLTARRAYDGGQPTPIRGPNQV